MKILTVNQPWASAIMRDATTWLVLSDPEPFDKPIPARGMQGFWNWAEHK